jgi:hypothetical protein
MGSVFHVIILFLVYVCIPCSDLFQLYKKIILVAAYRSRYKNGSVVEIGKMKK